MFLAGSTFVLLSTDYFGTQAENWFQFCAKSSEHLYHEDMHLSSFHQLICEENIFTNISNNPAATSNSAPPHIYAYPPTVIASGIMAI